MKTATLKLNQQNLISTRKTIRRHSRHFTLVEIIIVLTIMMLMVGVVGINVRSAVNDQRFKSDAALVVDILRFAQDLMLIVKADVEVVFAKKNNRIVVSLETDKALTAGWNREIARTNRTLQAIETVRFENQSDEIRLNFLSGGSVMSHGVLELTAPDEENRFICLHGYPHPIKSVDNREACEERRRPFFEDRLTLLTRQEIFRDDVPDEEKENK